MGLAGGVVVALLVAVGPGSVSCLRVRFSFWFSFGCKTGGGWFSCWWVLVSW